MSASNLKQYGLHVRIFADLPYDPPRVSIDLITPTTFRLGQPNERVLRMRRLDIFPTLKAKTIMLDSIGAPFKNTGDFQDDWQLFFTSSVQRRK